ncbi:Vacuolar fusion protein mon1 [Pseudocyphellaria aurata]|nr:Vacuolar fusion protein mon1 [Pseudocyphellaria aurata]
MPLGSPQVESSPLARDSNDEAAAGTNGISASPPLSAESGTSPQRHESPDIGHDVKTKREENNISDVDFQTTVSDEGPPPPLPPRPGNRDLLLPGGSLQRPTRQSRPNLQSTATTALSLTDIHTQLYEDGSREMFAASTEPNLSSKSIGGLGSIRRFKSRNCSEGDDSTSVKTYAPTLGADGDAESLLGEVLGLSQQSSAWRLFRSQAERPDPIDSLSFENDTGAADFDLEFDEVGELDPEGKNEEELLSLWKSKKKHFLILSSAGKPIYNRHGDDNLISGYIGVIQTIISFYEGAHDQLKGFIAGGARFVVMAQGPLYLVAISKLGENDAQLRVQLEALYMQILSTLTLPTLTHLFSNRPSTDLRRPLQGTEPLLSALADSFTRGSPQTLLSALECLKIRTSHRQVINNTLLQNRCDSLLYGLIVAGGRLVSVIRPRRHSLHPSDLQLIFNMLFEAEGIKAGGGENWIPLCLPGFNRNGYLYMYVSFVGSHDNNGEEEATDRNSFGRHDEVAVLLISANKESFYDLRAMRDAVVEELKANNSMATIQSAMRCGRPAATDIIPGTVLHHFLYKSRANVQFVMPSYDPHFTTLLARRRFGSTIPQLSLKSAPFLRWQVKLNLFGLV